MEQTEFNQMPQPRNLRFRKKMLYLLIFPIMSLVPSFAFYHLAKEESLNYKVKAEGIKTLAKIEDIQWVRSGKSSVRKVSYIYEFNGTTYHGHASERYGSHQVGQVVTLYLSPDDPSVNRAEFFVGELKDIKLRWFMMLFFSVVPTLTVALVGVFVLQSKRKILLYGTMGSAKIISLRRGKSPGADVEYIGLDGITHTRIISFPLSDEKVEGVIQIVYDPNNPKKVLKYPDALFEVVS